MFNSFFKKAGEVIGQTARYEIEKSLISNNENSWFNKVNLLISLGALYAIYEARRKDHYDATMNILEAKKDSEPKEKVKERYRQQIIQESEDFKNDIIERIRDKMKII